MSLKDAIEELQGSVKTAKGRAALQILETELQAGGGNASRGKAAPSDRGGFGGAKGIVREMTASRSARGGGTA